MVTAWRCAVWTRRTLRRHFNSFSPLAAHLSPEAQHRQSHKLGDSRECQKKECQWEVSGLAGHGGVPGLQTHTWEPAVGKA